MRSCMYIANIPFVGAVFNRNRQANVCFRPKADISLMFHFTILIKFAISHYLAYAQAGTFNSLCESHVFATHLNVKNSIDTIGMHTHTCSSCCGLHVLAIKRKFKLISQGLVVYKDAAGKGLKM